MKNKTFVVIGLITIILLGTVIAYKLMVDRKNEREGQEKFTNAISELLSTEPQFNNPCLGTSVLRNYSFSELNSKTTNEIKDLARIDPGSC
jgi:hypothetical protein